MCLSLQMGFRVNSGANWLYDFTRLSIKVNALIINSVGCDYISKHKRSKRIVSMPDLTVFAPHESISSLSTSATGFNTYSSPDVQIPSVQGEKLSGFVSRDVYPYAFSKRDPSDPIVVVSFKY